MIERMLGVSIRARGRELQIKGQPVAAQTARSAVDEIGHRLRGEGRLTVPDVVLAVQQQGREAAAAGPPQGRGTERAASGRSTEGPVVPTKKLLLTPKTDAQRAYIDALKKNDIVIGIGPAGTGKTYLAMGMAVAALLNREVSRIVLTRPAVEAGEHLGFLPGDLYAKVNPFVRPLYDALYDMMEVEQANRLVERGEIEIVPLAYMRGRTLNDAFIILDEAQNTTAEQMKMFLTRMGFRSKVVVTGDVTQVDLPTERPSGLVEVQSILSEIPGIAFVYFTERDVVRHPLLQDIIRAYEQHESKRVKGKG
ncbi:MAG: PhoH family protein [Nitrospirae bacterium]|nr:PhoH family protein [Nitrospirota bacterium]